MMVKIYAIEIIFKSHEPFQSYHLILYSTLQKTMSRADERFSEVLISDTYFDSNSKLMIFYHVF